MSKHRLFIENQSSPDLNSSVSEKMSTRRKVRNTSKESGSPASKRDKIETHRKENKLPVQKNIKISDPNFAPPGSSKTRERTPHVETIECSSSEEVVESDSDTDSMEVVGFFNSPAPNFRGSPYSIEEDELILKFVLKGQNIFKVGSISLWKFLESKKENPKRTYQSLKNRFLRSIKPHLFTTYRHLIKDEETIQKILSKFPELKREVGRKTCLSEIKLPERKHPVKTARVSSTTNRNQDNSIVRKAAAVQTSTPINRPEQVSQPKLPTINSNFSNTESRRVKFKDGSLIICVNLKSGSMENSSNSLGIYETYLKHKASNKLIPCSACGRCGGPEQFALPEADADSDDFVSNSIKSSKKSLTNSVQKKFSLRGKGSVNAKRAKKNLNLETFSDRSCSPSLLNDVNKIDEFDKSMTDDVGNDRDQVKEICNSESKKEMDSTPEGFFPVSDKDLDSIYKDTVAEFRKLIDSEEEEVLVKKCLQKNRKIIGFDPNLSVEEIQVDSFFVRSNSPTLNSAALENETATNSINDKSKNETNSVGPLAKNMMKMLEKDDEKIKI